MQNLRGGSRAAATSKMECFVIIVNGSKSLTIITEHSILDVATALEPPMEPYLMYYSGKVDEVNEIIFTSRNCIL